MMGAGVTSADDGRLCAAGGRPSGWASPGRHLGPIWADEDGLGAF